MSKIHPYIKIVCVVLLSTQFFMLCRILFSTHANTHLHLQNETSLLIGAGLFPLVFAFFVHHYNTQKAYFKLIIFVLLSLALSINGVMYYTGSYPPLYIQYSQSTTLAIFAGLCLIAKAPFPNWERIFAITTIMVLTPCLFFYFMQNWIYYENLVYILCFMPVILSFMFLPKGQNQLDDVLDD